MINLHLVEGVPSTGRLRSRKRSDLIDLEPISKSDSEENSPGFPPRLRHAFKPHGPKQKANPFIALVYSQYPASNKHNQITKWCCCIVMSLLEFSCCSLA